MKSTKNKIMLGVVYALYSSMGWSTKTINLARLTLIFMFFFLGKFGIAIGLVYLIMGLILPKDTETE